QLEVTLTAQEDPTWPLDDRGFLFTEDVFLERADSIGGALAMGVSETQNFIMQIYGNLRGIITRRISHKLVCGPIMIGKAAFVFAEHPSHFLLFIGIISVNLAVFNFLPIPVLDGGHMVFLLYEKLRGKPAPELVRTAATFVGVGFILLLMCFVIFQ